MQHCKACKQSSPELDHETCVHCMLAASQCLLNAADSMRDGVMKMRINTSPRSIGVNDLYRDASQYVRDVINWQDQYKTAVDRLASAMRDYGTAKEQYAIAWRSTRLFSDASIMARYCKARGVDQPYHAYALHSAYARNDAANWTVKARNDIWCRVHKRSRYSTGLLWALLPFEDK